MKRVNLIRSLVNPAFAERLQALRGYEIVFICDDSGSMNAPIGEAVDPHQKQFTRCKAEVRCHIDHPIVLLFLFVGDELKQTVSIVVDLASILDPDGVDVYFLNREPMLHVRSSSDLEIIFSIAPEGISPPSLVCSES